jgi:hypothetical protein
MTTETLDSLYLEYSNITMIRTARDILNEARIKELENAIRLHRTRINHATNSDTLLWDTLNE